MANNYDPVSSVFQALSDPTRRAVVQALSDGPATVSDLARPFDMALPSFVQHLKVLEERGIIRTEKHGRVRTCTLNAEWLRPAEQWIEARRQDMERHLDALESHLNRQLNTGEEEHE